MRRGGASVRSAVALATLATLALGCATSSSTTLGRAPSDDDLVNDGTIADQLRLYDAYMIEFRDGRFERANAASPDGKLAGAPTSADALDYLASAPRARAYAERELPKVHRALEEPALYAVVGGATVASFFVFGAMAGTFLGGASRLVAGDVEEVPFIAIGSGAVMSVVGVGAAAVVDGFLFVVVRSFAAESSSVDYTAAARVYDARLIQRIEAAARPPPARAPDGVAAPVAAAPPAVEPPPALDAAVALEL